MCHDADIHVALSTTTWLALFVLWWLSCINYVILLTDLSLTLFICNDHRHKPL